MAHGYKNVLGEERIQVPLFQTGDATLDAVLTDWFFGTAAGGGVTATLAIALAVATVSGTGGVAVTATGAATLGAATLSSSAQIPVSAAGSATLGAATLAGAGPVAVGASLAQSLGSASLASTGSVPVAGTFTATLEAATVVASGSASGGPVEATLTVTLAGVTATGTVVVTGVVAAPPPRFYLNKIVIPQASVPAQHVDRNQVQRFLDLEAGRMRARLAVEKKNLQDEIDEAQRHAEQEIRERIEDAKKDRHHTNNHLDFEMGRLKEEERAVSRFQNKLRLEDGRAILADKRLEAPKKRRK